MPKPSVGHAALPLSIVASLLVVGCKKDTRPSPPDPSTTSASASIAPASSAKASSNPAPSPSRAATCSVVGSPISIAKGTRSETGATAVRMGDGRLMVGYAVGATPRASVIDTAAGTASTVDVDASAFATELTHLPKGSVSIHRVTPAGVSELKVRVLVDATSTGPDKMKQILCGFADKESIVSNFMGAGSDRSHNCRSFTDGKKSWILSSWGYVTSDEHEPRSRWQVHPIAEDGTASVVGLGVRNVPDPDKDRYSFDLPASIHESDAGFFFAGRFNGNLALSRQAEGEAAPSELALYWFDAPSGMPALAVADRTVTVIAPIAGKPALYGASYPVEAKPPKPTQLPLDADGATERTSLSIVRAGTDSLLGFVETKGAAKRVKVAVLDAALKPRLPVFELPNVDKPTMARLVPLEGTRVLVLSQAAGEISATTVECPAP
ncbi:hypothetical protein LVJ94_48965 [Pendulispora rubella]|uniref:Uncharacterized protein n=1 Tax=Pendulispora rubella TaxID=2741070 RepID=A0ABZ2L4B8_9BACT